MTSRLAELLMGAGIVGLFGALYCSSGERSDEPRAAPASSASLPNRAANDGPAPATESSITHEALERELDRLEKELDGS
jgi:hypothetical protein